MTSIYPRDRSKAPYWWASQRRRIEQALAERNERSVRARQSHQAYFRRLDDRLANVARYFEIMRSLAAVDAELRGDVQIVPAMGWVPGRVQFV
jgi:hypothetical protein